MEIFSKNQGFATKIEIQTMKEIVLQVGNGEYDFILKLLQQLNAVKVLEKPSMPDISPEKMDVPGSIQIALREANLIQNGQLPGKTPDQFLAEVDN